MRKVILSVSVSLDGYLARPDGTVDFLFMPPDLSMAPFLSSLDTALVGRKTYDAALRMTGGSWPSSPMATYVFSRSLPAGERDGLIFTRQTPAAFIRRLRQRPGKHIWHMGGGELAREFLQVDLVDELHLGIVPVLLGDGIPLFPSGFPQRDFTLVGNRTYSQGLIRLQYKRTRPRPKRKSRPGV